MKCHFADGWIRRLFCRRCGSSPPGYPARLATLATLHSERLTRRPPPLSIRPRSGARLTETAPATPAAPHGAVELALASGPTRPQALAASAQRQRASQLAALFAPACLPSRSNIGRRRSTRSSRARPLRPAVGGRDGAVFALAPSLDALELNRLVKTCCHLERPATWEPVRLAPSPRALPASALETAAELVRRREMVQRNSHW